MILISIGILEIHRIANVWMDIMIFIQYQIFVNHVMTSAFGVRVNLKIQNRNNKEILFSKFVLVYNVIVHNLEAYNRKLLVFAFVLKNILMQAY